MCYKYLPITIFLALFFSGPAISDCPDIPDIKIADSFGVKICAMPDVDQKYLEHAKKVMDGLIDYNDDGIVDNQSAIDRVISTGSVYAVFRNGRGERTFDDVFGLRKYMMSLCPYLMRKVGIARRMIRTDVCMQLKVSMVIF